MECLKCSGFMYGEEAYAFGEIIHFLKCINCGEFMDAKILANRKKSMAVLKKNGGLPLSNGNGFDLKHYYWG